MGATMGKCFCSVYEGYFIPVQVRSRAFDSLVDVLSAVIFFGLFSWRRC